MGNRVVAPEKKTALLKPLSSTNSTSIFNTAVQRSHSAATPAIKHSCQKFQTQPLVAVGKNQNKLTSNWDVRILRAQRNRSALRSLSHRGEMSGSIVRGNSTTCGHRSAHVLSARPSTASNGRPSQLVHHNIRRLRSPRRETFKGAELREEISAERTVTSSTDDGFTNNSKAKSSSKKLTLSLFRKVPSLRKLDKFLVQYQVCFSELPADLRHCMDELLDYSSLLCGMNDQDRRHIQINALNSNNSVVRELTLKVRDHLEYTQNLFNTLQRMDEKLSTFTKAMYHVSSWQLGYVNSNSKDETRKNDKTERSEHKHEKQRQT